MKVHAARPWQTRPIAAGTGPKPEPADTSVSGSAPDLVQAFENVARQSSVRWRSQPVGLHRGSPLALGPRTISNVTPPHEFRTHLLALGPDGAATWRSDVPTNMNASPIADSHGRIYIGTPRGLACLDGDTGGALWETEEYPMTRLCPRGTVEWSTEGGMGRPVLSRDEKTVYFPLLEGVVVALSTEDGSLQWHAARPGQQESSRGPPARPHRAVGTKQRLGWRGQARHPQSLHQLQIDPQRRVLGKTAVKREIDPLLGAARELASRQPPRRHPRELLGIGRTPSVDASQDSTRSFRMPALWAGEPGKTWLTSRHAAIDSARAGMCAHGHAFRDEMASPAMWYDAVDAREPSL